jgi:hypothetical protein
MIDNKELLQTLRIARGTAPGLFNKLGVPVCVIGCDKLFLKCSKEGTSYCTCSLMDDFVVSDGDRSVCMAWASVVIDRGNKEPEVNSNFVSEEDLDE